MKYVLIIHFVEDFEKWKSGFDSAAKIRKEAGELSFQVLLGEENSSKVVHFSEWKNHDEAKLFFESVEVQKIRTELGVQQPEFIYLNEIESGVL